MQGLNKKELSLIEQGIYCLCDEGYLENKDIKNIKGVFEKLNLNKEFLKDILNNVD